MTTTTTAQRARKWQGPALFSYGFRPFFLFGAAYAAIAVAIWVPWYLGFITLPTLFPPIAWHTHELLFGYVPAVVAGFLLTAVPNWTGRLPVVGWPLAGLFAIWLAGRIAVTTSQALGPGLTALVTLAFLAALVAVIGREIAAGKNWRNGKVLVIILLLLGAQALFQWEVWRFGHSTYGAKLAIAAAITLISLIGGRIVPSFTGNWLKRRGAARLPASFTRYDVLTVLLSAVALALWISEPAEIVDPRIAAVLLMAAGAAHLVRQIRWQPQQTLAEPLVVVLHIAYLFIPVGFLLAGLAALDDRAGLATGAVHAWTAGAIGTMTLAVMTRASLGHTGHALTAGGATIAIYLLVVISAISRIAAALNPDWTMVLIPLAGLAWIGAFACFALFYGPLLLTRRSK